MAFLRSIRPDEDLEVIRGQTLTLRQPAVVDYAEWAELRALSRAHLTPWEPTWAYDDLARPMYRRRLRAYAKDIRDDASYPYFIFDAEYRRIDGRNNPLERAPRFGADGIARLLDGRTLRRPRTYARRRRDVDARRVWTAPPASHRSGNDAENIASIRVLELSGFTHEGVARAYLKINGRWEDHLLYARVATAPISAAPRQGGRGLMPSGGSTEGNTERHGSPHSRLRPSRFSPAPAAPKP